MSDRNNDASRPSIPSNLRIRRGRGGLAYNTAVLARQAPTDDDGENEDQLDVPGLRRGSDGFIGEPMPMTPLGATKEGTPGASTAAPPQLRRRGVVEQLAMSDRIANAQRRADSTGGDQRIDQVDTGTAKSLGPPLATSSSMPTFQRPRLAVRPSTGQLPVVNEMQSPNENDIKAVQTPNEEPELLPSPSDPQSLKRGSSPEEGTSTGGRGRLTRMLSGLTNLLPTEQPATALTEQQEEEEHHAAEVADYLDVIDPEVGTLGYLTNVQNSIFIPHIPMLYDRRPVHDLPGLRRRSSTIGSQTRNRRYSVASPTEAAVHEDLEQGHGAVKGVVTGYQGGLPPSQAPSRSMLTRVTSAVGLGKKRTDEEAEYDKHIKEWRDMDDDERDELDEHVRLVLRKKSKFHRTMKGFWAFVHTPMGFIMTLYGVLVTFWGTAIMLFIFGWIHVGHRRRYWIEICDQILCALFACVGLGFAPFRAVDTYRMIWIAKMHYRTWDRRKQLGLNSLPDKNDLPRPENDGSNQVSCVETGDDAPTHASVGRPSLTSSNTTTNDSSQRSIGSQRGRHWWSHPEKDADPEAGHSLPSSHHRRHKSKRHLVVPQRKPKSIEEPTADEAVKSSAADDGEDDGKTGDLKELRDKRVPLKRNDTIQSELVKEREDIVVLTPEEQAILEHHQRKFHASHTFYRFHETSTHRAFPLDLMIAITCLLDCHSLLQGALGGCTWGIKYTHRPTALTATIITFSLSCNAMAGILIYVGGRKTKKREEVERRLKIALETMALAKIERRRARGELPERHGGSKGSSTPHHEKGNGSLAEEEEEEESSDERQAELHQAVDQAARETEEEDQAPYDEPVMAR